MADNRTAIPAQSCQAPLTTGELGSFELTPDGKIYLDEVSDEQIVCLAERYLRTGDMDTRSIYRQAMQNGAWEGVRDHLIEMGQTELVPAEFRELHTYILENEFVEKDFSASVTFQVDGESRSISQESPSESTEQAESSFGALISSGLNGLFIFPGSKLKLSLSPEIELDVKQMGISLPDGSSYNNGNVLGLNIAGSADYFSRDDSWNLAVSGSHNQSLGDTLPDSEKSTSSAHANGQIRDILGSGVVSGASFDFAREEYEKAANPDFNTRSSESLAGTTELSYQNRDLGFGGLLRLSGQQYGNSDYISITDKTSFSGSLLSQLRLNSDDTLRVGGGGGFWNENFERTDLNQSGENFSSELHFNSELNLKLDTIFELQATALFQYNHSEGTFNGWFPSWETGVAGTLNLDNGKWKLSLDLDHTGKDVDLDITQRFRRYSVKPSVTYLPTQKLKFRLGGEFRYDETKFYEAFSQTQGSVNLNASYQLNNCSIYGYAYYWGLIFENGNVINGEGLGGGMGLSCQY